MKPSLPAPLKSLLQSPAFWLASILTTLFFLPFFAGSDGMSGYILSLDTRDLWLPQLAYADWLLSKGVFVGLDWLTQGGASEYFLRPNIPVYYPPALLVAWVLDLSNIFFLRGALIGLDAVHAFACCWFLFRFCRQNLKFDKDLSAFVAASYTFSIAILSYKWFTTIGWIAWLFPLLLVGMMHAEKHRRWPSVVIGAIPAFLCLLAGYTAMSLFALALAAIFGIFWHTALRPSLANRERMRACLWALAPLALAFLVCLPLYIDAYFFHQLALGDPGRVLRDLAWSAHEMGEEPSTLPRFFANSLLYIGKIAEQTVRFGLIATGIVALFLLNPGAFQRLQEQQRRLMLFCFAAWLVIIFSIYGESSPISDLFYYFLPIIGGMHIYQRLIPLAQLFLLIGLALMLLPVADSPDRRGSRWLAGIFLIGILALPWLLKHSLAEGWSSPAITNDFILEAAAALLFFVVAAFAGRRALITVATLFMVWPGLAYLQDTISRPFPNEDFRLGAALLKDTGSQKAIVDYFQKNRGNAEIITYIDITPGLRGYIPENLPWYLAKKVPLSTYYGYERHLAIPFDYNNIKMPVAAPKIEGSSELIIKPDWEWVKKTGAKFVIYETNQWGEVPELARYADLSDPARVLTLPERGTVIAPLKFTDTAAPPAQFENGIMRLRASAPVTVKEFKTNGAGDFSFKISAPAGATLQYLFWPNRHLSAIVQDRKVEFPIIDGLQTLALPAGDYTVRVTFMDYGLVIFLGLSGLYALSLLVALRRRRTDQSGEETGDAADPQTLKKEHA